VVFCVNEIITEYQLLPVESIDACLNHWMLSFGKLSSGETVIIHYGSHQLKIIECDRCLEIQQWLLDHGTLSDYQT
jgi:hypothetical protein